MVKKWIKKITSLPADFKKQIIRFVFFLSISTIFWFLTALEEDYTQLISYPVKYINLPKDKIELIPLPEQLELNVSTSGYNLINYYMDANVKPLIVDYQSKNIRHIPGKYDYLLTKYLSNTLSKSFTNISIHNITPDTLRFHFYEIKSKKVPVKPLLKYAIKEGYVLKNNIFCYPDSVVIKGAEQDLKKIDSVVTGTVSLGIIDQNVKRNLALKSIKNIEFSKQRANISIQIEQSTEKTMEIPITVIGAEDKATLQLIPNKVNISFKVGLSHYYQMEPNLFSFSVNYPNDSTNMLEVKKIDIPNNIYDLKFSPQFVEYLLIEND